jgi:hypothetical protein
MDIDLIKFKDSNYKLKKINYICECGYETNHRDKINRHINRKTPCVAGTDMSKINIDDLCIKGDWNIINSMTPDEKKNRIRHFRLQRDLTNRCLDNENIIEFARNRIHCMKSNSKQRGHEFNEFWNIENVVEYLNSNRVYKVDTSIGQFEFPLKLSNGHYNSASFDRICDNFGYNIDNIELRPFFLNTPRKLTTEQIRQVPLLRENPQSTEILQQYVSKYKKYFTRMARAIKYRCDEKKERNVTFDFNSVENCADVILNKYIRQGGRCAYSYIPIYPSENNPSTLSIERIDPTKSYNDDNMILIVVGLNSSIGGQFRSKYISEEYRQKCINAATFNQEYWDKSTLLTTEIKDKIKEVIEHDKQLIINLFK